MALFLFRKVAAAPAHAPVFVAGPPMDMSEAAMSVRPLALFNCICSTMTFYAVVGQGVLLQCAAADQTDSYMENPHLHGKPARTARIFLDSGFSGVWLLQGWLAEYVAKAKDVAGVKEGPNGSTEEASAAEAPAAEKRLVLYGRTQASPGLTGLFRTARTEPMGERLRLVCDATHPGSGPEGAWSLVQMPVDGTAIAYCGNST